MPKSFYSNPYYFTLAASIAILLTVLLHSFTYYNTDVTWLLSAASRVLAGEELYTDVNETNPPLIVWLNMAIIWLGESFSLSLHNAMLLGVTLASLYCLIGCWIINKELPGLNWFILLAILMVEPMQFGQREQFFVYLSLPYLLGMVLQKRVPMSFALVAGIGIAIKPYFAAVPLSLLAYDAIRQRSLMPFFTRAQLTVAMVQFGYLAAIFLVTPYIGLMLPDLVATYKAYSRPIMELSHDLSILTALMLPLLLVIWKFNLPSFDKSVITRLLILAFAGLIVLLLQMKGWANHRYIYLFLCSLSLGAVFMLAGNYLTTERKKQLWALSMVALIFIYLVGLKEAWFMLQKRLPSEHEEHVEFMLKTPHHTVTGFSFGTDIAFPKTFYGNKVYCGTYGHLWFLPEMVKNGFDDLKPSDISRAQEVINNFIECNPDLVLIAQDTVFTSNGKPFEFDFLAFFRKDRQFDNAWKNYEKIKQIDNIAYYQRVETFDKVK